MEKQKQSMGQIWWRLELEARCTDKQKDNNIQYICTYGQNRLEEEMSNFYRRLLIAIVICLLIITAYNFGSIYKLKDQIRDLKSLDNNPIVMIERGTVYTEHSEFIVFDTDSLDIKEVCDATR